MKTTSHQLQCFLLLTLLIANPAPGDDWPQFLGASRNGKSRETGLISTWPKSGLSDNWRVPLGEGMSGISIHGKYLVSMYQDKKNQYVVCLNAETGKNIWETAVAPRYENSMGHGPRATPTISGGKVFAFSGEGILTALELDSGKLIWSKNPQKQLKGKPAEYGMSGSPLVVQNQVIVPTNPGDAGFSVCAYSVDDGTFKWGTMNYAAGYASPAFFETNNRTFVLIFSGESLFAVDPETGKARWEYPFKTAYNCNTATPVTFKDKVLISSGENHGSALLSISKSTENAKLPFKVKEEWKSLGRDSSLRSEWQTPIYHEGFLYGFDNVGSAGPVTHLTCIDAIDGSRKWSKIRFGKGNLIFADSKLIISTMKGELVLVKANHEKFEEIGRQRVIGQTRQAPALSNGKVYLRDNREIVCIDLSN